MDIKNSVCFKMKMMATSLIAIALLALLPTIAFANDSNQTASINAAVPSLETKSLNLDKNYFDSDSVKIKNLQPGDTVQVSSSNKSVARQVGEIFEDYLTIQARKKGKAVITVKILREVDSEVDGSTDRVVVATLKLNIKVSALKISVTKKKSDAFEMYKGEYAQIKIKNKEPGMRFSFYSSNKKSATVSKNGKIHAIRSGNTYMNVLLDKEEIHSFNLGVGTKDALKAVRWAEKYASKAKYSQTKRMQKGYADCSSLVGRAYQPLGYLMGGTKAWSSTAAEQARWCANNNHVLFMNARDVVYDQLAPGDLLFYRLDYNGVNPGYRHIDHVAMFIGSGMTLEAGLGVTEMWEDMPMMVGRPTEYVKPVPMATGLRVKKASAHSVKVTWNKMAGVTGYQILRANKTNYDFKVIATVKGASKKAYIDRNLASGKLYRYQIRAYLKSKGKTFYGKVQSYITGIPLHRSVRL